MKFVIERSKSLVREIKISKASDGRLFAHVPHKMPMVEVKRYLEQHAKAISHRFSSDMNCIENSADFEQVVDKNTSAYFTYQQTMIFGTPIKILCSSQKQRVELRGGILYVAEKYYKDPEYRRKTVQDYLKRTAKEILGKKVSQTGSKIRMCPAHIDFKQLKGNNWCNCSDACNRIITMDFRTIQLPENLQDYIIMHCFSHFFEVSHSSKFFAVLSKYVPNYKLRQEDLTNYEFLKDL